MRNREISAQTPPLTMRENRGKITIRLEKRARRYRNIRDISHLGSQFSKQANRELILAVSERSEQGNRRPTEGVKFPDGNFDIL
jgi:hypothetical protein